MSKRKATAASKMLTGGSGDVKPQILSVPRQQVVIDETFSVPIALPVPRVGVQPNKATITEILKVWIYLQGGDTSSEAWAYLSTISLRAGAQVGITYAAASAQLADPHIIAGGGRTFLLVTSGGTTSSDPELFFDLTDGAGNGILVATDEIFFEGGSDNASVSLNYWAKILYRVYDAGIMEYVGIVQSQQ